MSLPAEIGKLLPGEPAAHAALNCSASGPIGETHLVVAGGRLILFMRESLIGEFIQVAIDPRRAPMLEPGDFADTLHVYLVDGASVALSVSSFEREAVIQTLAAAAASPAPQTRPAEPTPQTAGPGTGQPLQPPPPTEAAAPFLTPPVTHEPEPEDDQAEKEPAIYAGSTLRLLPCLAMLLFFFCPVLAMWFLHEQAMYALTLMAPGEYEGVGVIYVTTKILALVGGVYATVKLLGLLTRLGRARNWDGHVVFDRSGLIVSGPGSKWEVAIDRSRPFDLACECHAAEPQGQTDAKTEHIYYLQIEQQGQAATLRMTGNYAAPHPSIAGVPVVRIGNEKQTENTLAMDGSVFLRVAARLRKMREPFAKAASMGDNAGA